jgi:hypothetical protein
MRRYMSSHFEFHDKENTGTASTSLNVIFTLLISALLIGLVNDASLRACLQRLGFALSPQHRSLLFQRFGRPG